MFLIFPCFWQCFNLENIWCGEIVMVKDHVQFYINFNSESFQICYMASLYHTHQYVGIFKLIYFVIFFILVFYHCLYLEKMWPWKNVKVSYQVLIRISSNFLQ